MSKAIELLKEARTCCLRLNAISICSKISCHNGDIFEISDRIRKALSELEQDEKKVEELEAANERLKKRAQRADECIVQFEEATGGLPAAKQLKAALEQDEKKIEELEGEIGQLKEIFDHPNHANPKQRYLYEIRIASLLLRQFSEMKGGGERAFGVATQLEQFHKRASEVLKGGGPTSNGVRTADSGQG